MKKKRYKRRLPHFLCSIGPVISVSLLLLLSMLFSSLSLSFLSYSKVDAQKSTLVQPTDYSSFSSERNAVVNLSNNTDESALSTALLASGNNVYVIWSEGNSFDNQTVYFKESKNNGNSFGDKISIFNNINYSQFPGIAASGNNLYLVWADNDKGIFFKSSTDNGLTWSSTKKLSNQGAVPRITAYENNVYILWRSDSKSDSYLFSASTDNGTTFGDTVNIINSQEKISSGPIMIASENDVYIGWISYMTSPSEKTTISTTLNNNNNITRIYNIFFKKSTDNGTTFDDTVKLSNNNINSKKLGSLDMTAYKNSVYAVWGQLNRSSGHGYDYYDLFITRSFDNGFSFAAPAKVFNEILTPRPMIAAYENSVYVAWSTISELSVPTQTTSGINTDIYLAESTDNGLSFGDMINISNNTAPSKVPDIDVSRNNVYFVWIDNDALGLFGQVMFTKYNSENIESTFPSRFTDSDFVSEQLSLMHQATPINTLGGGEQEQGSLSHQVKVWIDAPSPQTLSSIEKVIYHLHSTFNPSEITKDSPEDNFLLELTVWGQFEIKATVYFKDGSTKDLSRYLSFTSTPKTIEPQHTSPTIDKDSKLP
jgi:hypothetical protein